MSLLITQAKNSFPWFSTLVILALYLTIIPRVRVGNEIVDNQRGAKCRVCLYNHLISNKREWNNCFIRNAHKISRILPDFLCKNNDFQGVFNFEQTRTVTMFGEHGIMAHTTWLSQSEL